MTGCVDWQWADGKRAPQCRRKQSCGAWVPDKCPLAAMKQEQGK